MKAPVESRYTSEPLPFTSNTDFICAQLHWGQKLEDVHSQQVLIGVGFVPPVDGIKAFQNTYMFSRVLDVLIVGSCIKKLWKSTPTSPECGCGTQRYAAVAAYRCGTQLRYARGSRASRVCARTSTYPRTGIPAGPVRTLAWLQGRCAPALQARCSAILVRSSSC